MRYSVYLNRSPYPSNFCDTEVLLYCKFISKIMVSGYMSRATKREGIAKKQCVFSCCLLVYGVAKISIEKQKKTVKASSNVKNNKAASAKRIQAVEQ